MALFLVAAGCAQDPNPPTAAQFLPVDYNDYVCSVQPIVAKKCAMLACHGNPAHAFRVYAPARLRLGPTDTTVERDAALTLAEAKANFASAQGMTLGAASPDVAPMVRKALAPSQGGGGHVGGVIFRDTSDPDYQALLRWASGETMPLGCALLNTLQ